MRIFTLLFLITCVWNSCRAQKTLRELRNHPKFAWLTDTLAPNSTIYYLPDSWTSVRIESVRQRISAHVDSVKRFVGTSDYKKRIHVFIVGSREEMKDLIGYETNGTALYADHVITGIAGNKTHSIYSNHEFFHVIAMNTWGMADTWINEGMAVYSDKKWHGHDLHGLSRYLVEQGRYIGVKMLIRNFRKADSMVSYPLIGSFVMYLDNTYGRDAIVRMWRGEPVKKVTGRSLKALELDWLDYVKTVAPSVFVY